jgi:hypothetical protein
MRPSGNWSTSDRFLTHLKQNAKSFFKKFHQASTAQKWPQEEIAANRPKLKEADFDEPLFSILVLLVHTV